MSRSALVTGGSRGIGLGIATRLAQLGYSLTITARDQTTLDTARESLIGAGAPTVHTVAVDLSSREAADEIVGVHSREFGSMSALILNAGVGTAGSIAEYPMNRFDKTLDVNVRAPFQLLQLSLPLLRAAVEADPNRGAKVIALASLAGVYSEAGLAVYGATKAAVLSLVETLNFEESKNGVTGTSIAPGYVETDMSAWIQDRIPAETMIKVEDIVELAASVLQLSSRAVVPRIVVTRAGAGLQA